MKLGEGRDVIKDLYDLVVENVFLNTVTLFARSDHGMSNIFLLLTLPVFLLYRWGSSKQPTPFLPYLQDKGDHRNTNVIIPKNDTTKNANAHWIKRLQTQTHTIHVAEIHTGKWKHVCLLCGVRLIVLDLGTIWTIS